MKVIAFAALSMVSVFASAKEASEDAVGVQPQNQIEQAGGASLKDAARVTSVKHSQDPEKADGLVKTTLTYVDGNGVSHSVEYTIMGYGRQNG